MFWRWWHSRHALTAHNRPPKSKHFCRWQVFHIFDQPAKSSTVRTYNRHECCPAIFFSVVLGLLWSHTANGPLLCSKSGWTWSRDIDRLRRYWLSLCDETACHSLLMRPHTTVAPRRAAPSATDSYKAFTVTSTIMFEGERFLRAIQLCLRLVDCIKCW